MWLKAYLKILLKFLNFLYCKDPIGIVVVEKELPQKSQKKIFEVKPHRILTFPFRSKRWYNKHTEWNGHSNNTLFNKTLIWIWWYNSKLHRQ